MRAVRGVLRPRATVARRTAALALLVPLLLLPGACTESGPSPPPLLLLVTVDTLRADRLGAFGSSRELTPRLDALAAQSLVFQRAYAAASFTLPSVASLHTGRYPEELGIRDNESGVPPSVPSLASVLRERGWRTGAAVSNFVLRASSGLAHGFDVFDDEFTQEEATRGWPERAGVATTEAALAVLDSLIQLEGGQAPADPAPMLLWVHYQDPHGPYTPPAELRETLLVGYDARSGGGPTLPVRPDSRGLGGIPDYQYLDGRTDAAFYLAGYDAEVAETDRSIGLLLDGVRARGLYEEAVVVFGADHGEGLGEDDYWFAHGELLSDPLVNVPLLLRVPGIVPGTRDDVASLVDIAPTLLGLLDAALPPDLPGRDLLSGSGKHDKDGSAYMATLGGALVPRFALMENDHKFVLSWDAGTESWKGQLYERTAQGKETPVPSGRIGPAMRRRLKQLQQRYDRGTRETRQALGDAEIDALRALGYTGREDLR